MGLESERAPSWACGAFVAACTIVGLVVFETLFFILYVGPIVEPGNVRITASGIAEGIVGDLSTGMTCEEIQTVVRQGVEDFPKPADGPANPNHDVVANVLIMCCFLVVLLAGWWFLYLDKRIPFPWFGLVRETLPLFAVFAAYDVLYFHFFVERWNSGSSEEFLHDMGVGLLQPPPYVPPPPESMF